MLLPAQNSLPTYVHNNNKNDLLLDKCYYQVLCCFNQELCCFNQESRYEVTHVKLLPAQNSLPT